VSWHPSECCSYYLSYARFEAREHTADDQCRVSSRIIERLWHGLSAWPQRCYEYHVRHVCLHVSTAGGITSFRLALVPKQRYNWRMPNCTSTVHILRNRAPEVFDVKHANGPGYGDAADCWSLGVTLYVILSGTHPFTPNYATEDEKTMRLKMRR
jgi:hypothetical protein